MIAVPVNSEGEGPVSYEECVRVDFEVWNQVFDTVDSFEFLPDAINLCEKLNEEYHV